MATHAEHLKSELVERVVGEARTRLSAEAAADAVRFIRRYLANVPPGDILGFGVEALFGAAVSFWKLAHRRPPGQARLRVFNPDLESHGWESEHTVVETINDDMPFLVDSLTMALNRMDLTVHLIVHPILQVRRDSEGRLRETLEAGPDEAAPGDDILVESYIHMEITAQSGEDRLQEIHDTLAGVLADVRTAVDDFKAQKARLREVIAELAEAPAPVDGAQREEVRAFLQWLHDNHFTLLGYRYYGFQRQGRRIHSTPDPDSGLGVLREPDRIVFEELRHLEDMPEPVRAYVQRPDLLTITKCNRRATIHRPVHMDAIGVKRFDERGRVIGQHLFVGLFTSVAYSRSPREIPLLRRKVEAVARRAGFPPDSHDGKALTHTLETFPRDELLQANEDDLFHIVRGIVHLQERKQTALFVRRDDFQRFVSCLVFVPRDRYNTQLRRRIQDILETAFNGRVADYYTQVGDSPLARLHLIVSLTPGEVPEVDPQELEKTLIDAVRSWSDRLFEALCAAQGEERGQALHRRYQDAFPANYQERFNVQAAVHDIETIEATVRASDLGMNLYRPIEADDNELRFKIYHHERAVRLSDVLPMLENMGLKVVDEIPYPVPIGRNGAGLLMIHDFGLITSDGRDVDLAAVRERFQDGFRRVWEEEVENDGFNRLVLAAGLDWRSVVILRAYAKYLRQAAFTFSQSYIEDTLVANPKVARGLVELFAARLDPARQDGEAGRTAKAVEEELHDALEAVESADDDRILRRFLNLVLSTLRTNHYQPDADGRPKPYLALKLDSTAIEDLPLPHPWREIFVYSPRVEAVHLRGGPVARGGIRWSDRREDFRTEVLGLMKAQMIKNAVIVPVGSKGGFVVKRPPADGGREALTEEGVACYKTMMRGLLDLTDNRSGSEVVPPPSVVRHDEDDPYLVVAADKGTATFSDIANGISQDYGFWLGDAFASGGSSGYDHKAMGITARGAWESVKRHFRELERDIQSEDFTVVGIGDMAGDVFGNGMLLSRHIRLVAAFNHMHVFVDPDPDPEASFEERRRLFEMPRSTWADYDPEVLSKGGAVYERRAKSVRLTPEIRRLLELDTDTLRPNELIRAILRCRADLLWFGGIGTYVKAEAESHAEVGDRSNDAVRIDAHEVRAVVVGEGANLGVTQRGRIEYALAGGRINTDSIDNSGGVDCSDHEVNIKIVLDEVVRGGDLTLKQRDALLERMTDEVAELVLRDNYLQSQALSLIEAQGADRLDHQARLIRMLERSGRLNRQVEVLPDEETLAEREAAKTGLTRPEIAVLMSHSKIWLFGELLETDLPDDPQMEQDLLRYFPTPVQDRYADTIGDHRLRREIIATTATNSMINRVGGTFVLQVTEETGMDPDEVARAYIITRDVFRLREVWEAVEELDTKVPASIQTEMLLEANRLVQRGTLWFLRHGEHPLDLGANVRAFEDGVAELAGCLDQVLRHDALEAMAERAERFRAHGVPEDLAQRVAGLMILVSACDIVRIADARGMDMRKVAELYFAVGPRFGLGWMRAATEQLAADDHWQKLATTALIEDFYAHQCALTLAVLDANDGEADGQPPEIDDVDSAIDHWATCCESEIERTSRLVGELLQADAIDFAMLTVASRQLRTLTEA